jgi:hypothetical protein
VPKALARLLVGEVLSSRVLRCARAYRIGEFWGFPESRAFGELLIACEEDRTLPAGLVGMLREGGQGLSR